MKHLYPTREEDSMTTTETEAGFEQWNNKRVIVVRNLPEPDSDGNATVEVEGMVQVGNEMGLLIKPKGKVTFDLIPADEIEEVYEKPAEDKKVTVSRLQPVEADKVKRHLADRHGLTVSWLNSVTDAQALEYHNGLDHKELDLGHIHVTEAEAKAADEAGDETDEA